MNREDFKELRAAWRMLGRTGWSRDNAIRFRAGELTAFTVPERDHIPWSSLNLMPRSDAEKRDKTAIFDLRRNRVTGWCGVWGRWMGRDGKWAPIDGPWRIGESPFDDLDLRKEAELADWDRQMGRRRA